MDRHLQEKTAPDANALPMLAKPVSGTREWGATVLTAPELLRGCTAYRLCLLPILWNCLPHPLLRAPPCPLLPLKPPGTWLRPA